MKLSVEPSGAVCGATVRGVDLGTELAPDVVAEIRAAWLAHKVLAFPDQALSDVALVRFASWFGPEGVDPFFEPVDDHPRVAAIHRRADETGSIFADNWHADWSFQRFPPDGTCLHARVVPPVGGDTLFADQTAVLAALPPSLRDRIEGAVGVHSARGSYAPDGAYGADDAPDRAMRIVPGEAAYATETHPLIRVHPETGAETLYSTLGYIIGIEGMDRDEAVSLLREVAGWQGRQEFLHRQRWEHNMLVMWDNRCVLHKATGGYEGHERLLHRVTVGYNPDVRPAGRPCP